MDRGREKIKGKEFFPLVKVFEALYIIEKYGNVKKGGADFSINPARELTVLYMQHVITSSAGGSRPRILEILHEILD